MLKKISYFIAMALASSTVATAHDGVDPNWNYVEGGYVFTTLDDFNPDLKGFGVRGSIEIHEYFFSQEPIGISKIIWT